MKINALILSLFLIQIASQAQDRIYGLDDDYKDFGYFNLGSSVFNVVGLGADVAPHLAGTINISLDSAYVSTSNNELFRYALADGKRTSLGVMSGGQGVVVGLDTDPTSGKIYAVTESSIDNTTRLYTLDITTSELSLVGASTLVNLGTTSLGINGDGQLFIIGKSPNALYELDKNTGEATLVGELGYFTFGEQGMSWNPNDNTMYINSLNTGNNDYALRSLDLNTGLTTRISGLFDLEELGWIAFPNPDIFSSIQDYLLEQEVSIYPNPIDMEFTIENTSNINFDSYSIVNTSGQIIQFMNLDKSNSSTTFHLNNVPCGIYFIQLRSKKGFVIKKIIKK